MKNMSDKLSRFYKHQDTVLDHRHIFLIDYRPEILSRMKRETVKKKLRILESVMK